MNEIKLGKLKKSKIVHIIENDAICKKKTNIKKYYLIEDENRDKYKFCKLCNKKKQFNQININNKIYYELNNIIYNNDNILKHKKYAIIKDNKIIILPYTTTIDLIKLNKIKYYLVNDNILYDINNQDIFNNNLDNSIGKILGPQMAIIYEKEDNKIKKKMIIIDKIKYNMWSKDLI